MMMITLQKHYIKKKH